MRLLLLSLSMFLSLSCFSDEVNEPDVYVWKSKAEPIDYKCVPDKEVGLNWALSSDDHELTTFKPSGYNHFFLAHISNVPLKSFGLNLTESAFEHVFYEDLSDESLILEKNSYFFRTESDDPNSFYTYSPSTCQYFKPIKGSGTNEITCTSGRRHFEVDLDTMRFVSSYLGTWHSSNNKSDYAGNSAFLSYGQCRKYFR